MINVGYFTHSGIDYSETFIYDLLRGLNKEEDLVINFFVGESRGKNIFDINGIKCFYTGFYSKCEKLRYSAYSIGHFFGGNGYNLKMKASKKISLEVLRHFKIPPINVAYIDYATTGVLLREYLQEKKIPCVIHVHGYDVTSATIDTAYVYELRNLFKVASHFITASNYMKRLLILLGCDERKISVIRYGVDVSKITPMRWEKRIESGPGIIFLGRLTAKKQPIALLLAFKKVLNEVPDAYLSIIGDGPMRSEVENKIRSLGIQEKVKLHGAMSREDAFKILNYHWVYAQHSVASNDGDHEGFAISIAEAAAHELPVVSTLHDGIPENVIDGKTGYLVREFDYESMADRIVQLLRDPFEAKEMGIKGREYIEKLCNPNRRIREIKKIILDIHN